MIDVIVNYLERKQGRSYPYVGRYKEGSSEKFVLFDKPSGGITLKSSNVLERLLYSNDWVEPSFEVFTGDITIRTSSDAKT